MNRHENRGWNEQVQRVAKMVPRAAEGISCGQGRIHDVQFESEKAQQKDNPLPDPIFPLASIDVAQEQMEGQQNEKCAGNLVISRAPTESHGEAGVRGPKHCSDESGGRRTGNAPTDLDQQHDIGDLRQKRPDAERQHLQAEQRRKHQEEEPFAERADGALGLRPEKHADDIRGRMDFKAQSEPGKIVRVEPDLPGDPMNQQAKQNRKTVVEYLPAAARGNRHYWSLNPTRLTIIPSSRESATEGGSALSSVKSARTVPACRAFAGTGRV